MSVDLKDDAQYARVAQAILLLELAGKPESEENVAAVLRAAGKPIRRSDIRRHMKAFFANEVAA